MVELVDTRDLKSLEGNLVPVRVRPSALANAMSKLKNLIWLKILSRIVSSPSSYFCGEQLYNERVG